MIISIQQWISGKRLKERRELLKENCADKNGTGLFTQQYVADTLHVSKSVVCNHEHGFRCPTMEQYMIYCEIYNCDMNYLTGYSDEWKPFSGKKSINVNMDELN